jgi:hypothetical protein
MVDKIGRTFGGFHCSLDLEISLKVLLRNADFCRLLGVCGSIKTSLTLIMIHTHTNANQRYYILVTKVGNFFYRKKYLNRASQTLLVKY